MGSLYHNCGAGSGGLMNPSARRQSSVVAANRWLCCLRLPDLLSQIAGSAVAEPHAVFS